MTEDQLSELLILAFEKMTRYEREHRAIFDEVANHPERRLMDSVSLKNISVRISPLTGDSLYERLKSILSS